MRIITSGQGHTDIDALASGLAYKEICNHLDIKSELILPGPINESITQTIRRDLPKIKTKYITKSSEVVFVILDTSHPDFFADFVDQNRIIEIYDHHFRYENYWKKRLEKNSHIELVGSNTTLIWEKFKKEEIDSQITTHTANLLLQATLAHTLNLQSTTTSERDEITAKELKQYSDISDNWIQRYFRKFEETAFKKPVKTLVADSKQQEINQHLFNIYQIEIWNGMKFVQLYEREIQELLKSSELSFLNCADISRGYSLIISYDKEVISYLEKALNINFTNNFGKAKRLIQRKVIIKKLQNLLKHED